MNEELQDELEGREAVYRLLGRIYRLEADKELFSQLRQIKLPSDTGKKEFDEGAAMMEKLLDAPDPDFDLLAADYARTFLAAGIARGQVAFPYESVYTSPERIAMQDAYEEMLRILTKHGLASSAKDVYPDHIAIELEFMAYLCHKAKEAAASGDDKALEENFSEQKEFLEKHLFNWTDEFTADIRHWAEMPFYQAAARITKGFLDAERESFA